MVHASMMEKIKELLSEIKPGLEFDENTELIKSGIITSLDIVRLVGNIQDEFDIEISVIDLIPENFDSIKSIEQLVIRLQEEA